MATIKTPVEGFDGVVVGVTFTNGSGKTSDPAKIQYFERHGYGVEHDPETPTTPPAPPAPPSGDTPPPTEAPRGNASQDEWLAYAKEQGRTDEELDGMTRDQIRDLFN